MKMNVEKKKGIAVIHINGNLDALSVMEFKKEAAKLVDEGCNALVMDCATMDFVDSMGLGAMISLLRRVRTHQGDLKVAGLTKDVRSVFEITRLTRLFDIAPDWQTACTKFG